ncbi:MAG TPA: DegT/DnrJ/EryC1/StrS family aminotransferase, partial [Cryomorphaceae bacterium]|nr:DegT/DnrJ/EryC1/StrS family aminotransferase [Cryomorphaceae bacterium]
RKAQWNYYSDKLENHDKLKMLVLSDPHGYNAAYFPIILKDSMLCERAIEEGKRSGIELRKYFSPSLNLLDYVRYQHCPISESISSRICCLPLFHELTKEEQDRVLALIHSL